MKILAGIDYDDMEGSSIRSLLCIVGHQWDSM